MTTAFCERVKERGYRPAVYYNLDYLNRFYGEEYFKAHPDYVRWYARPGLSKPDRECDIWQYACNNGLADFGYNGDIDKNIIFDGDLIKVQVEPMKPLSEDPCRMYIGFASSGDVKTLVTLIEGLGIKTEVVDGYITTGYASKGDQCYVMTECNRLKIPCKIYEEPKAEQTDIEKLRAKVEELQRDLDAEVEFNRGYQEQLETANNKLLATTAELLTANKALSASRETLDSLTAENANLKSTINKVKEILQ